MLAEKLSRYFEMNKILPYLSGIQVCFLEPRQLCRGVFPYRSPVQTWLRRRRSEWRRCQTWEPQISAPCFPCPCGSHRCNGWKQGIQEFISDKLLLPIVNWGCIPCVDQREFEEGICDDGRGVGKPKQGVVGENGPETHQRPNEQRLVSKRGKGRVSVDNIHLLFPKYVPAKKISKIIGVIFTV